MLINWWYLFGKLPISIKAKHKHTLWLKNFSLRHMYNQQKCIQKTFLNAIAALKSQNWKQPKCPSTVEWTKINVYVVPYDTVWHWE